ncbi:hypothetical protein [Actinomadura pelletieri]|uniref:hypothetical protein n=1 Tax=Actinomadura pelletieri TaxID=111805 RepID=UPI001B85F3FD|nr:hypothetical protein [Actinomadura pelletieri]
MTTTPTLRQTARYDALCLDIDNGPDWTVTPGNARPPSTGRRDGQRDQYGHGARQVGADGGDAARPRRDGRVRRPRPHPPGRRLPASWTPDDTDALHTRLLG